MFDTEIIYDFRKKEKSFLHISKNFSSPRFTSPTGASSTSSQKSHRGRRTGPGRQK